MIQVTPKGVYQTYDAFIGYGGFKETHPKSNDVDFMYALFGEYFGRGLGSQIARELLEVFKNFCSNKKITSLANPDNHLGHFRIVRVRHFFLEKMAGWIGPIDVIL